MHIERIQVEEGFLSGLDITLAPGLNVIIGARGTGKTSLIELIRFCLDAAGNTADAVRRSREHALSILGSGQVTLTIVSNEQRIIVSRTASDVAPRTSGIYVKPIVFSQTEIETVGLEASGRLRLIDSFISTTTGESAEEKQVNADVASYTAESAKILRDIE
jgi:predicted ATPase